MGPGRPVAPVGPTGPGDGPLLPFIVLQKRLNEFGTRISCKLIDYIIILDIKLL
jgi:hypothetical protein